jgi:hypothetical protein
MADDAPDLLEHISKLDTKPLARCSLGPIMIWALAFGGLVAGRQMVSALGPRGTR